MTDPIRNLFREARVLPPPGFNEILTLKLPAKLRMGGMVTISPQVEKFNIESAVSSNWKIERMCMGALKTLAQETYVFPLDPRIDPLERIATPGAGEEFREDLIDQAGVTDVQERHNSDRILENYILPAHEALGHIAFNLDQTGSCYESRAIWGQLIECLATPTLNEFLDFPDQIQEEFLFQHYIVGTTHELYAVLVEEEAWRSLESMQDLANLAPKLKDTVRSSQDHTVVALLKFLSEKSGGDLRRVKKIIDNEVMKADMSLSHFIPHLLRDLGRGVEIDRMTDYHLKETERRLSTDYTPEGLQKAMNQQRIELAEMRLTEESKAMFSTYFSLNYNESNLMITFYSQAKGDVAVRAIPTIVTVHVARKTMDERGQAYPISPESSMQSMTTNWIRSIANGTYKDDQSVPPYQFDALKDFGRFYTTWRPALLIAQEQIRRAGI